MSIFPMATLHGGAGTDAVQLLPVDTVRARSTSPCYAGIRLDADGRIYTRLGQGNWSRVGQWLLFGTNSTFYVTVTIESGSLTTYGSDLPSGGTHTAADHATVMTDSAAAFVVDALIGQTINNTTDASSGTITDNDATTVTVASLSGGADDSWDGSDAYTITGSPQLSTDRTYDISNSTWGTTKRTVITLQLCWW